MFCLNNCALLLTEGLPAGVRRSDLLDIYIGVFIEAVFGAAFHIAMRGVERILVAWQR